MGTIRQKHLQYDDSVVGRKIAGYRV